MSRHSHQRRFSRLCSALVALISLATPTCVFAQGNPRTVMVNSNSTLTAPTNLFVVNSNLLNQAIPASTRYGAGNGLVLSGTNFHFGQSAAYTPGLIPFAAGTNTIGFGNLFWDSATSRMSIGLPVPGPAALSIAGDDGITGGLYIGSGSMGGGSNLQLWQSGADSYLTFGSVSGSSSTFYLGFPGVGATYFLRAKGSGILDLNGYVRPLLVGASKILRTDSSTNLAALTVGNGLSFDGTNLIINLAALDIPPLDAAKITTGTMATARLGSGTAASTNFLSGDQTYKQVADAQVSASAAIAKSKIATNGTWAVADIPSLSGTYLPLAGGSVTGPVTFQQTATFDGLANFTEPVTFTDTISSQTYIRLGGQTNRISDNGTAITFNGSPIGSGVNYWERTVAGADAWLSPSNLTDSVFIGPNSITSGANLAVGSGLSVGGVNHLVSGLGNSVIGKQNTVGGWANTVDGTNSVVFGEGNSVTGQRLFVIGNGVTVTGDDQFYSGYPMKSASYLSLNGKTNRISDSGAALTFNGMAVGAGTVTGSGTVNRLTKFLSASVITNSVLAEDGTNAWVTGTGAFTVPSGTTAQQPAGPTNGMMRYNTTTSRQEFYTGAAWRNHVRLDGDTMTGPLTNTSAVLTTPTITSPNTGGTWVNTAVLNGNITPVSSSSTDLGSTVQHIHDISLGNWLKLWNGSATNQAVWLGSGAATGILQVTDHTQTTFTRIAFGQLTAAFPAWTRTLAGFTLTGGDGVASSTNNLFIPGSLNVTNGGTLAGAFAFNTLPTVNGSPVLTNALGIYRDQSIEAGAMFAGPTAATVGTYTNTVNDTLSDSWTFADAATQSV